MIRRADYTVADSLGTPEPGVYITVKDVTGDIATLYGDDGMEIGNPLVSGVGGAFYYNVANSGVYTEEYRLSLAASPRHIEVVSLGQNGGPASIRLTFGRPKSRAIDRPDAVAMAADLTAMVGWAKVAGTTGGVGGPVYWVTKNVDDGTANTLRWAVQQVADNGIGQALFDPRNEFEIELLSRIDVPANCTIAAPGRNVRIKAPSGVNLFNCQQQNFIIRWLELTQEIDPTGINNKLIVGDPGYTAATGGPSTAADGIGVNPITVDKFWIDENTIVHVSDGALDVSASLLTVATSNTCRYTVSRNILRGQYKCMLAGSNSAATGDTDVTAARKVFGTYLGNWYDHCAERMPRVGGLGYADSVNNVFDLASLPTDDTATGEYGMAALYGGWLRTRGDLFRSLDGVASEAVQRSDGSAGIPASAVINEGSVAEGVLTIAIGNTGIPTALPTTNYDVVPLSVPTGAEPRAAFRDAIRAAAGARVEAMPPGQWVYSLSSADAINGFTSRAAPEMGSGRYLLLDDQTSRAPSSSVTSVAGRTGAITLTASDISGLSTGSPKQADGVFFSTYRGDLISDLSYPVDAALVVNDQAAYFSASSVKALNLKVKRADGSILAWCFDTYAVDATYAITSFPAADVDGVHTGVLDAPLGVGNALRWHNTAELKAHPSNAAWLFARGWNSEAPLVNDTSNFPFTAGASVRVRYTAVGNIINMSIAYPGTADHPLTLTQVFASTSFEMPRYFAEPTVQFVEGIIALTAMKVSAAYPNATYGCVGDSITQGRFASTYANAWVQKLRAAHVGQVLSAGAPSATTADWLPNVQDVVAMRPKYCFVMLGTNDILTSVALATIEANITTIMNQLIAGGITPVILTVPPNNQANTPTLNTWIKAQGWRYVDIYAALLGTGVAMNATYDSGDGIHPNDAGHTAIYNAVAAYITANGLT